MKWIKRIVFCCIAFILISIVGFGLVLRAHYQYPVIMYHYVNDSEKAEVDKRIVIPQVFEMQMRFLKRNNYNVISLEEFAYNIKHNKSMPHNTIVLTLDDGYEDNYLNAFPILKKYNLPATIFVWVNKIGEPGFLKEAQIRQMSNSGIITIGSHTLSHSHLPSLTSERQVAQEIFASKQRLEQIIRKPVTTFSYPIGGFNEKIRSLVIQAGYDTAVATSPGLRYPNNDPYAIKRVRISQSSKNLFVFWFETSGLYKYLLELRKEKDYD